MGQFQQLDHVALILGLDPGLAQTSGLTRDTLTLGRSPGLEDLLCSALGDSFALVFFGARRRMRRVFGVPTVGMLRMMGRVGGGGVLIAHDDDDVEDRCRRSMQDVVVVV